MFGCAEAGPAPSSRLRLSAVAGSCREAGRAWRPATVPCPGLAHQRLIPVLRLPSVTCGGRPAGSAVDRVVERAGRALGASCAFCAFGRAVGAASASGAVARVSRNELVVGSIPTGGSLSLLLLRNVYRFE